METSEYEQQYSEQIKFFDWPHEWRLDRDDEDQLQADLDADKVLLTYLQRRKLTHGTKGTSPQVA